MESLCAVLVLDWACFVFCTALDETGENKWKLEGAIDVARLTGNKAFIFLATAIERQLDV